MTTTSRNATVALLAARISMMVIAAGFQQSAAGELRALHTIEVVIVNDAAVPEDVLKIAQVQAARIYEGVGVAVHWLSSATPATTARPGLRLTMKLVPHSRMGRADEVMGFAVKSGNVAYVFLERIGDFALHHQLKLANVLAHTLAHELGHLLLQGKPHGSNGIMRAN